MISRAEQTEYISSAKVIFSDRSSIYFGLTIITLMIVLSLAWLIFKFQKKTYPPTPSNKVYANQIDTALMLKHRFLFKPNKANHLLFFLNGPKKNHSLQKPQKDD
jgi:hypothetical protein